ncbi:hypothetical protein BLD48_06020 [Exiguobacterium sp. KRL4]|uniref:hypothetical protein n=1 Tax=Exiguobacterium sp. KRL4 TaxID=1914536 RepID=UPI0008F8E832|nr:hypothetical protein [Exiguobacterium sp. KRL4]OIN67443.1 hypothetical protein BLD48_06020 [Exiguobacterium sp. KRL4]
MEKKLWMVYDSEEGLIGIYEDLDVATKEYENRKVDQEFTVADGVGFEGDERVVLAAIKRDYRVIDTEEPVVEEDELGNEYESGGTYAAFKEFVNE